MLAVGGLDHVAPVARAKAHSPFERAESVERPPGARRIPRGMLAVRCDAMRCVQPGRAEGLLVEHASEKASALGVKEGDILIKLVRSHVPRYLYRI